MSSPVVIVGSLEDPHVRAVRSRISRPEDVVVLDVASLADIDYTVTVDRICLGLGSRTIELHSGWRGWIRRLSPPDWEEGLIIGSHDAAAMAAWLSLVATLLRYPDAQWLTGLDAVTAAENKMTQYNVAARLGLSTPHAVVTNLPHEARYGAEELVAKPLGPGHFRTKDGEWRTVFTETFDPEGEDALLLAGPPFIVQKRLRAVSHKRVVTVDDRAWVFALDAEGLPIDWREEERAHREWELETNCGLGSDALLLATELGVGYSSQDWVETSSGLEFLDLNPGGQWLFLPDPGASEISQAIAEWLSAE